jgi:hypothetical protein
MSQEDQPPLSVTDIAQRIQIVRGQRVILDDDLAAFYAETTKRFNQQVRRNLQRFPADFMFQLDAQEFSSLRLQSATLKTGRGQHRKYLPLAFTTPIKFQLDWRFEGPAALFLARSSSTGQGLLQGRRLDVTIDAGNGSGGTVTRVASGTYDMGFADLAALMEFHANNPDAPNKPVAVMMVYNNTPAAVLALKKSGIKTKPADLNGKKLGAPVFDAGRRAFPIFAKANNISGVHLDGMDPPLRETMLARGDVTPSPASRSPRCSTWKRAASRPRTSCAALPRLRRQAVRQRDHRQPQADQGEPGRGEGVPGGLHQGRQGSDRQPRRGHRLRQGARRHHQRRPGKAPPAHGHRHRGGQPRRARRRLRPGRARRAWR